MSRAGYTDDCEYLNLYRANVDRSLGSKRGQAFFRELAAALDSMPEKRLIADELVSEQGECCTMGAVCKTRSLDVSDIDPDDSDRVGALMGISRIMVQEIAYMNDEWSPGETAEHRWQRMRTWVDEQIVKE